MKIKEFKDLIINFEKSNEKITPFTLSSKKGKEKRTVSGFLISKGNNQISALMEKSDYNIKYLKYKKVSNIISELGSDYRIEIISLLKGEPVYSMEEEQANIGDTVLLLSNKYIINNIYRCSEDTLKSNRMAEYLGPQNKLCGGVTIHRYKLLD